MRQMWSDAGGLDRGRASAAPAGAVRALSGTQLYLALECAVLYIGLPLLLWVYRHSVAGWLIPGLLGGATMCTLLLWRDRSFDRTRLWRRGDPRAVLKRVLWTWILGGAALAVLTYLYAPELFLRFPRQSPAVWLMVMVLYPALSVYPQEIIFRTFLFHRYRNLLPSEGARMALSAGSFGLAHLFFGNWIAVSLSAVGGLLFARTYLRTRSTVLASLEHALWGDYLFTIGLGWYFYTGSIR